MTSLIPLLTVQGVTPSSEEINVAFELSRPFPALAKEQLKYVSEAFILAGAHGGFPSSKVATTKSKIGLVFITEERADVVSLALKVELIDRLAFQLLRSMVARLKRNQLIVSSIIVSDPSRPSDEPVLVPPPDENNEESVYPNLASNIGFELEREQSEFSMFRRCLVEICQQVAAERMVEFSDWIKPWFLILEAGGFAMPVGLPDETESLAGSVSQFDETTIEIVVNRFQASECAWNVLINMIASYQNSSFTVSKVTID